MTRVATRPPERPTALRRTARRDQGLLIVPLVIGLAVPLVSTLLGLYDNVEHWGKVVHAVDGFCAAFIFGLLFLGWREATRVDVADELAALMTVFFGILFGVLWEIVEFVRDWVAYSDLQKSNMDTMTDFLFNDVAVVVAMLVAMHVYCRRLGDDDRRSAGRIAEWLVDGPSRVLDRHGITLTVIALCVIGAAVASLWFADRPVPGIPIP